MSEREASPVVGLLILTAAVPGRAWRYTRRIAGYVLSGDDSRAVYGNDANGLSDGRTVSGSATANITGGMSR